MTLFDPDWRTHVRRSDPDTSHAAAESMTARPLAAQQQAVLDDLRSSGPSTAAEIAGRFDRQQNVIVRRCRDLTDAGRVVDSGARRVMPSGRHGIVWAATESAGVEETENDPARHRTGL